MLLRFAMLALVIGLSGLDAHAASPESNARLLELLESVRATSGAPALAASVVSSRGTIATAATGRIATGDDAPPVTVNSRFHLGTGGKVFTGMLAAVLAGRGDLRVPGPALLRRGELGAHAGWSTLSLGTLLSHHSTLPAWPSTDTALRERLATLPGTAVEQRRDAVKTLLAAPPSGPLPSAQPAYSTAAYVVAGHLLEADARVPYETLLEKEIFAALGLRSCEIGWPSGAGDARPHTGAQGALLLVRDLPARVAVLAPAGDVSCSVRDLARLAGAHLRGLALAGRPSRTVVIRKDTRIIALRNTLGWTADRTGSGQDVYTLVGGNAYYTVLIALFPANDRALVVLTNIGEQPDGKALVVKTTQALRNRYGF